MVERCSRIDLEVELEDLFEIVERFFRKNNHGCLRDFGCCTLFPLALLNR
jgi:hypothetical protein